MSHLESCTELESSGINHDIFWGKTLQCNLGFMEAEETQKAPGQGVLLQPVPSNGSALGDRWSCCCYTPPGAHTVSTDDTLQTELSVLERPESVSAGHHGRSVFFPHLCLGFLKPLSKKGKVLKKDQFMPIQQHEMMYDVKISTFIQLQEVV